MANFSHKLLYFLGNFLQLLFIFETASSSGLSIKLIHRDSPESPFYSGFITGNDSEHIKSSLLIRPRINNKLLMYLLEVGIGTFAPPSPPHIKYFLHLDTGSVVTWIQCEDCRKAGPRSCFDQVAPLFPAKRSRTYRPLPCGKHSLCFPGECINKTCSYLNEYGDGASTLGYLAYESFAFASDKNITETVKNVVFGCGIKNQGFLESSETNVVAGNFGLGRGKRSFLKQKESLTRGRFSYCLPPWDIAHNFRVFLRFGDDIPNQQKGLKMTSMLSIPGSPHYFVALKGISVGNRKVDIPPRMFIRTNNRGGCIVDSGTSVTMMPPPVYNKLEQTLMKIHFSKYKRVRNEESFPLCYWFLSRKIGLRNLPNITFHLQDSDLVFQPRALYILFEASPGEQYFCLGIKAGDYEGVTIIGALQQSNTRFIFDTLKRKLYFGPEDCTLGA